MTKYLELFLLCFPLWVDHNWVLALFMMNIYSKNSNCHRENKIDVKIHQILELKEMKKLFFTVCITKTK